mmetsp:Transcript_108823/g.209096  ORF Transcript_108823/g.209096 Transcript_108823/m.209096 type:complete len:557 (+) Transcript_108823:159-1829(+)
MPGRGSHDAALAGSSTQHHFWTVVCHRARAYGCRDTDRHSRSRRKHAPAAGVALERAAPAPAPGAAAVAGLLQGRAADVELDISARPVKTIAALLLQHALRLAGSGPPPMAIGVAEDELAEAAVAKLWRCIKGAQWYLDVATGESRAKPLHLTMLRMAFCGNVTDFLEALEKDDSQTPADFTFHVGAHAVALLRLVHACHQEALLECDAALLIWQRLTCEQRPRYRALLQAGGHVIERALERLAAFFQPARPPLSLPGTAALGNLSGFALRVSPAARVAGHPGPLLGAAFASADAEELMLAAAGAALLRDGYAVLEDVFDASAVASIAAEVESMNVDAWAQARLKVYTEKSLSKDNQVADHRGDRIWWLDGSDKQHPLLSALVHWLRHNLANGLREVLCNSGMTTRFTASLREALTIERSEFTLPHAMLACYPGGGTKFTAHLDNDSRFPDNRIISAVFYLNENWRPEYGGALRIRKPNAPGNGSLLPFSAVPPAPEALLDVQPVRNTLVLFWSHAVEHEVLPAWRSRYAVSMWLRTAKEEETSPFLGRNTRRPEN